MDPYGGMPERRRDDRRYDDRGGGGRGYDDRGRGYDDRSRGYDDRRRDNDDDRRRRDYDDRDRGRDRERERDGGRPRRSGFEDGPPAGMQIMPGQAGMPQPGMMLPGFGVPNNPFRPNMPMTATPGINPKKQRELYVGNLPTGQVNEPMLKELYAQLLAQCDGFDGSLGPPVLNCQVRGGGVNGGTGTTFAFVEFRDETCSQTIARFNGMELYGRNLKISHPNGYVEPATPVKTFGVPDDLYKRFGLDSYEAMRRQDRPPQQLADRKSRELYVGNLTMGAVNSAMLIELFTYPLQRLPLGEGAAGISCPVVEAKVDQSGKFAFVLFADDQLATMALAIFNKMELCGRPLCVDRPAGYQPDMSRPLPPGMLENGMPTGGTGAPPEKAARAASAVAALAFENGPVAAGGAIGAASSSAMGPKPSHKLKLQNLLGPDEIADDKEFAECIDDIKDECARFGTLVSCVFPRPPELHGYAEADVGSCFVHYELMSAAVRAQSDLDGRDFDSRKVIATFVHEESKEESKEEPQEEAKEEPKPPEPEA